MARPPQVPPSGAPYPASRLIVPGPTHPGVGFCSLLWGPRVHRRGSSRGCALVTCPAVPSPPPPQAFLHCPCARGRGEGGSVQLAPCLRSTGAVRHSFETPRRPPLVPYSPRCKLLFAVRQIENRRGRSLTRGRELALSLRVCGSVCSCRREKIKRNKKTKTKTKNQEARESPAPSPEAGTARVPRSQPGTVRPRLPRLLGTETRDMGSAEK